MRKTTLLLIFLLLGLTGAIIVTSTEQGKKLQSVLKISAAKPAKAEGFLSKLKTKTRGIEDYLKDRKFNRSFIFYIDMSLPSYQNRFFVYDLEKEKVVHAALVTHGRCNQYWLEGRKYSNVTGSGCTSLGRYKIGGSYNGRFGLAFKLNGLDTTNSNAFERYVVLHSHECVPENEVDYEICQSDGCPTVSPGFLVTLKGLIRSSPRPVLLWIVE